MELTVSGRSVILTIGEKGGLAEGGDPVIIRYGDCRSDRRRGSQSKSRLAQKVLLAMMMMG